MMYNRVMIVLFVIALIFAPPQMRSQESGPDSTTTVARPWALQFGIVPNFALGGFNAGTFAAKYHFSKMSAVRVGITLSGAGDNSSNSAHGTSSDNYSSLNEGSGTTSGFHVSLRPQYLWYLDVHPPVRIFLAAGPNASYHRSRSESGSSSGSGSPYQNTQFRSNSFSTMRDISLGVGGSFGAEWFPADWVSLSAEYGSTISYSWWHSESGGSAYTTGTYPTGQSQQSEGWSEGWTFSNLGVTMGLSVYF
jgi:hypothetical protein